MSKFKVTVTFLKNFEVEAENAEEAKEKVKHEIGENIGYWGKQGLQRFYVQDPKDLSKPAKEKKKK